jgi:hypothetical protein
MQYNNLLMEISVDNDTNVFAHFLRLISAKNLTKWIV